MNRWFAHFLMAVMQYWKILFGVLAVCSVVLVYVFTDLEDQDQKLYVGYLREDILKKEIIISDLRAKMNDVKFLGYINDIWRKNESLLLGEMVQERIHQLQNPKDCSVGRKFVCSTYFCGFGCNIHYIVYCLIMSLAEGRTLLLQDGWPFSQDSWSSVFLPISETCRNFSITSPSEWTGSKEDDEKLLIKLPHLENSAIMRENSHLPPAIPEDLAPRLKRLHGQPSVWWIGQFLKYLLRPQPELKKHIEHRAKEMGFKNPVVGLHIRRTDKKSEASFYPIEQYMKSVEEYFNQSEPMEHIVTRTVYLATDDPTVVTEARQKFPDYEFINDPESSESAGTKDRERNSSRSLWGIIRDIHFLSHCDYLICTFSSNVCRLVYALMQPIHGDASSNFHSLDGHFFFHRNMRYNTGRAVERHVPGSWSEIAFEVGDIIDIIGNLRDGYSEGENMRTKRTGLFPSYKVDPISVARFALPKI